MRVCDLLTWFHKLLLSVNARISPSLKTEICKYFTSPSGCVRGDKCFFEHSEEEHRQVKQGTYRNHSHATSEFKRKIFVGGLPSSVNSG